MTRAGTIATLLLTAALVAACTGEGVGLPSGTSRPSRSGEVALPTVTPTLPSRSGEIGVPSGTPSLPGGGAGAPSSEPSPTPSKTKEPKPSPTQEPTPSKTKEPKPSPTEAPSPTTAEITVPPASDTPTPSPSKNKNKNKNKNEQEEEQTYGWILLLLIIAIAVGLIVLGSRRRKAKTAWTTPATNAYRSCSALRDRLAQELTTSTGVPWTQLLPSVDGAASTLYPLQTSPPDQQAALAVTHTVEALSAVRLALQAGAATPTPSEEAKGSLLRALGQLDTALEPLRFEATGRSGPEPVAGA
jgi:hypothetical protein